MENHQGPEAEPSREHNSEEIATAELKGLLSKLEDIESQIQTLIEEQGSIIRSRPETDAQYARLDELASAEARLRERESEVLTRLKALNSR